MPVKDSQLTHTSNTHVKGMESCVLAMCQAGVHVLVAMANEYGTLVVLSIKSLQTEYQISQPELEGNHHEMIQMLTLHDHIGKIVIAYKDHSKNLYKDEVIQKL